MDDLIKRDDAFKIMCEDCEEKFYCYEGNRYCVEGRELDELPSVNYPRFCAECENFGKIIKFASAERTGHWIPKNYVEYFSGDCASSFARAYTFECSECGTECPKQSKVCWECGARMKGEEE